MIVRLSVLGLALGMLALATSVASATGLDTLAKEMAGKIGQQLDEQRAGKVAVLEFYNAAVMSGGSDSLGGDAGAAGKLLATFAETTLANHNGSGFEVLNRQSAQNALGQCGFQLGDLGKPDRLACLRSASSADAIVTGNLWRWEGTVYVAMQAIRLPGGEVIANVDESTPFTPALASLVGESFIRPASAPEPEPEAPIQLANMQHPVLDRTPQAPPEFEMRILVDGRPLPLHSKPGDRDVWVPAREQQEYEILLVNNSDKHAGVVLLIDGLNSIGKARVMPDEGARKWIIKPGGRLRVKGWQEGWEQAKRFVFVPGDESLAARQSYTGSIGLVTATFYRGDAVPTRGGHGFMGTGEGEAISSKPKRVTFTYDEETPAAAISIRYDRADIVERMPRVP